ncbi:hypothetical protein G9H62_06710 [Aquirufa ecclesiirivi]|nr:hypothetical protein [Aquirufa ecclesiirivi]MCZ2472523.1 hypothetical protein [Aquirufa ecclesiirivi]
MKKYRSTDNLWEDALVFGRKMLGLRLTLARFKTLTALGDSMPLANMNIQ